MSKYIFVYPDVHDPERTRVSLPNGFSGQDHIAKSSAKHLIEEYGYSRVMVIKTDGEHADVIADYLAAGPNEVKNLLSYAHEDLGKMAHVV